LSHDGAVTVNLVEEKETKKLYVIKSIITSVNDSSTGIEERDLNVGMSSKLDSPYLVKYERFQWEEKDGEKKLHILMKYYERGSLSDISNRAELVKKFFSQNV
jgi:serine/threonine protein kinase